MAMAQSSTVMERLIISSVLGAMDVKLADAVYDWSVLAFGAYWSLDLDRRAPWCGFGDPSRLGQQTHC